MLAVLRTMDLTGRPPLELACQEIGHDGGVREGAVALHQPDGAVLVVGPPLLAIIGESGSGKSTLLQLSSG